MIQKDVSILVRPFSIADTDDIVTRMKAIQYSRYGGPDVLQYVDKETPKPSPDEALSSVRCASVIPGDWKVRSGALQEMFPLSFPTIPGRDGAGACAYGSWLRASTLARGEPWVWPWLLRRSQGQGQGKRV